MVKRGWEAGVASVKVEGGSEYADHKNIYPKLFIIMKRKGLFGLLS